MLAASKGYRPVIIDGHRCWYDTATGRIRPHVAGGSDPAPAAPQPSPTPTADPAPDRTFTQADLDAAAGRARAEGRKTGAGEVATELGVSLTDAKTLIDAVRVAEENKKSETQRALEAANTARSEAQRLQADAAAERLAIKVERRLLAAGVPDAAIARAARLVTVAADADDTAIAAEIDTLKAELPALFAATAAAPPAPGVNPAKAPAAPGGTNALDRGAELYAVKHPTPA